MKLWVEGGKGGGGGGGGRYLCRFAITNSVRKTV